MPRSAGSRRTISNLTLRSMPASVDRNVTVWPSLNLWVIAGWRLSIASAEAPYRTRRPRRAGGSALVLVAERDAALGQIIGRHLDGHAIAGEHADAVLLHAAGGVGQSLVPVVELHAEPRVGKEFNDDTVKFDQVFLGHALSKAGGAAAAAPSLISQAVLRLVADD